MVDDLIEMLLMVAVDGIDDRITDGVGSVTKWEGVKG